MVGDGWRLELVRGDQSEQLTLDDLRGMPQATESLPIACVEGWSAGATWTGVRVRDLVARAGGDPDDPGDIVVTSLQQRYAFGVTTLQSNFAADDKTLLALQLQRRGPRARPRLPGPADRRQPAGRAADQVGHPDGAGDVTGALRLRVGLGAVGVAVMAYGVWSLRSVDWADWPSLLLWLGGGVIAHDVLLAPVVVAIGVLAARRLPDTWRAPMVIGAGGLGHRHADGGAGAGPVRRARRQPHAARPALPHQLGDRDPAGARRGGRGAASGPRRRRVAR